MAEPRPDTPLVRYIRTKDVGTRMQSIEERNMKIVKEAKPLPEGNWLPARAIYWFVTIEQVEIRGSHDKLILIESITLTDESGVTYYLNQISFEANKNGTVRFQAEDGRQQDCYSVAKKNSTKKRKFNDDSDNNTALEDESQWATLQNNTNQTTFNNNLILPSPAPSQFVNILLLVPDTNGSIDIIDKELTKIDFKKEASSNHQHLYSRVNSTYKQFHILVVPYGDLNRYLKVPEYLQYVTEVILLVENEKQEDNLIAIECIENIGMVNNNWSFKVKTLSFQTATFNFPSLSQSARTLFRMSELLSVERGGASCKSALLLEGALSRFIVEWTLSPVTNSNPQMIYICFKYEPKPIRAFSEYAAATLTVLGIELDPIHAYGSVLVYLRCPSYTLWYIMMRKDEILNALADYGLCKIYECFISDVCASIQRPENEEFIDELTFLKEQMISDGIKENIIERFTVENQTNETQELKFIKEEDETLRLSKAMLDQQNSLFTTGYKQMQNEIKQMKEEHGELKREVEELKKALLTQSNVDKQLQEEIKKITEENKKHKQEIEELRKGGRTNDGINTITTNIPFDEITLETLFNSYDEAMKAHWRGQSVLVRRVEVPEVTLPSGESSSIPHLYSKHLALPMGTTTDPNSKDTMLVMEYLENGSLEDLLFKQHVKLQRAQIIQLALDIAKGLNYLHCLTPKIIHRDLKCENVLVSHQMTGHVTSLMGRVNFHQTNCVQLFKDKTRAKIIYLGTMKNTSITNTFYMAPEVLMLKPFNEKVDIYSFGMVLFAMLTNEVLLLYLEEKERLMKIEKGITNNEDIKRLIINCCRSDPNHRPTIHQCLDILKEMHAIGKKEHTTLNRIRPFDKLLEIPYEQLLLKECVGKGGYASVIEAEWNGNQVAVKTSNAQETLIHEGSILVHLHHKHVVAVLGYAENPDNHEVVIVMEYLKESSLDHLISEKNAILSRSQVLTIGLDIANALHYLHSLNPKIIHRDVKDSNVLLYGNRSRAKLCDFGVARFLAPDERGTTTVGTMMYIAPEILEEQSHDEKADVYSFGVLLCMMANKALKEKKQGKRLLLADLEEVLAESSLADPEFKQLILDCCHEDPSQRPSIGSCSKVLNSLLLTEEIK